MRCPQCSGRTRRSHTNGFYEKLIKAWTSYKAYRCRECGWRGWLRIRKPSAKRRQTVRATIGFLVTVLITMLLALYLIEKLNTRAPDSDYQQQSP
jgi:DNA-directed RNA polymerase subunit RPC12/RpoP